MSIEELEPWNGAYLEGRYAVRFLLQDEEGGQVYENVPLTQPPTWYFDEAALHRAVLPYTPGAPTGCRGAPDGEGAVIRARGGWALLVYFLPVFFGVVFLVTGVFLLRPAAWCDRRE